MNLFLIHPSDAALDEFGAESPARSDHKRIASHLERCQQCRNRVAFRRELGVAASRLTAPEPPPDLLDRVLRDRAAGERVILPVLGSRAAVSRWDAYRIAAAVLVIMGLGLAVTYARRSPSAPAATVSRPENPAASQADTLPGLRDLFTATVFLPGVASAEEPATRGEVLQPVAPQIDGTRMRQRDVTYQRQYIDSNGKRTIGGEGVLQIRPAVVANAQAWRVERQWVEYATKLPNSRDQHESETLLLDRRSLRPIQRDIDVSPYQRYSRITVAQKFNGDSVFGRMTTEGGDSRGVGRSFLQRIPNSFAPYVTDAFAPLFFTSVRLGPAWHGRLSVLGWAVRSNDVFYPLELRVVGKDRVTVPAGTFDCWHFVITSGARKFDYWARISDGLGVRSRNETLRSTLGVSEIVLVRSSP
jgi:hypothetical protein